jgi:hypothetical protein
MPRGRLFKVNGILGVVETGLVSTLENICQAAICISRLTAFAKFPKNSGKSLIINIYDMERTIGC